jgi:hypothetical protein
MKWIRGFLLAGLFLAGCTTRAKSNAQARAAFLAGQRQAMAAQAQGPSVRIIGNVKNPIVPWTEDLTLANAIVEADYQDLMNPRQIIVTHPNGQVVYVDPKKLLRGQDMPLESGDRIEIR